MTVYKLVVRGAELNTFPTYEQAMEELRALRALGESDAYVVAEERGEACYSWCVGARDIHEYLRCLAECDERGLTVTLPPPQDLDDLGV